LDEIIKWWFSCIVFCKQLKERHFLKCRDRHNLQNLMKATREREFAFGDRDQQVRTDRRPDLDSDAVGACGEESTQAQVLFDPAEEQFDQTGVDREQLAVQTQFGRLVRVKPTGSAHQHRSHLGEHPRVAVFVRIGQIAALDGAANPRVVEQAPARAKARFDVAQALPIGQLGEDHRREVIVGRQRRRVALHRIPHRAARKLFDFQSVENLGEDRSPVVHRTRLTRKATPENQIEDTSVYSLLLDSRHLRPTQFVLNQTAVDPIH